MPTVISLDDASKARADELIRSGEYSSFDEVVKVALADGGGWVDEEDEAVDFNDLPPSHAGRDRRGAGR